MEVFIAYDSDEQAPLLVPTFNAWAQFEECEPVGLLVKNGKFELQRRVAADNLAQGSFYILADLGCVPDCDITGMTAALHKKYGDKYGLAGFVGTRKSEIPCGVRVCKKGAVERWPAKISNSYDSEHAQAVKLAGFKVVVTPDYSYKHLLAC